MDARLQVYNDKMVKAVEHLAFDFSTIRAGRANPAILNKVTVDYYGAQTPLNQVGAISVPEARQILITPWDKSLIGPITKAIQMAELGVNPINDGNGVRLTFPELNEDRRKQIVKEVKALGEDAKVAVRNVRRDGIDDAKKQEKAGEITEDELKGMFSNKEANMPKINPFNAKNYGELIYNRKTNAEFSREMDRSIRENIKYFIEPGIIFPLPANISP